MLILDTNSLVDFFKGQAESLNDLFLSVEEGKEHLMISVVTLSELFYILARERGLEFSRACIDIVKAHVESVYLNEEIAEKAGELKFKHSGKELKKGLPLADCVIAATAMEKDATLLTKDPHFKKIKDLKVKWV